MLDGSSASLACMYMKPHSVSNIGDSLAQPAQIGGVGVQRRDEPAPSASQGLREVGIDFVPRRSRHVKRL